MFKPIQPLALTRSPQLRISLLGQREKERGVNTANPPNVPALLQLIARVLTDRLEHPVACAITVPICPSRHQRLLNQPPQRLQYVLGTYLPH